MAAKYILKVQYVKCPINSLFHEVSIRGCALVALQNALSDRKSVKTILPRCETIFSQLSLLMDGSLCVDESNISNIRIPKVYSNIRYSRIVNQIFECSNICRSLI